MEAPSPGVVFGAEIIYPLFSIEESEEFRKITITTKEKNISVYSIDDQKLFRSWSLRHGVTVTSPAVYNPKSQQYLCVLNYKEIYLWSPTDMKLEKGRKIRSHKSIHRAHTVVGGEPVIVNSDLTFRALSSVGEERPREIGRVRESGLTGDEEVVWSRAVAHSHQIHVLGVVRRLSDRICVYCESVAQDILPSETGMSLVHGKVQEFQDGSDKFVTADVALCDSCIFLFTLWATGTVRRTTFDTVTHRWTSDVSMSVIPRDATTASLVAVDHAQVVLAGVKSNHTVGVAVYNVEFGSQLSFQPFPLTVNSPVQVYYLSNHILVASNHDLFTFKFHPAPADLLSALGCQTSSDSSRTDRQLAVHSWSDQSTEVDAANVSSLFDKILNHAYESRTQFETDVHELIASLDSEPLRHLWLTNNMAAVITRCLKRGFWSRSCLERIIGHSPLPSSCLPPLFERVMEEGDNDLLYLSLTTVPHIPEVVLASVLDRVIGKTCKKGKKKKDENSKETHTQLNNKSSKFVDAIIRSPYNDVFLLDALRSLKFDHVLILLRYLHHLISRDHGDSGDNPDTIKMESIVDWLSLLIDAHVSQLILCPDATPLLIELHKTVLEKVEYFDSLVELDVLLTAMKTRPPLPSSTVGDYCIQVLRLS